MTKPSRGGFFAGLSITAAIVGCGNAPAAGGATPAEDAGAPGMAVEAGTPTTIPTSDSQSCTSDLDCGTGGQCLGGVCLAARCANDTATTKPPLGQHVYLRLLRDVIALDDGAEPGIVAYDAIDRTFDTSDATFDASNLTDIAGGHLISGRPETIAAATTGSTTLTLFEGTSQDSIDVGFVPIAITTGDVDADGFDEIIALSAASDLAVCHVATKSCDSYTVPDTTGIDLAAADVDGDGS